MIKFKIRNIMANEGTNLIFNQHFGRLPHYLWKMHRHCVRVAWLLLTIPKLKALLFHMSLCELEHPDYTYPNHPLARFSFYFYLRLFGITYQNIALDSKLGHRKIHDFYFLSFWSFLLSFIWTHSFIQRYCCCY